MNIKPRNVDKAYSPTIYTPYKLSGKPIPKKSDNSAIYDKIPVLNQGSVGDCTIYALFNWDYIMRQEQGLPYEEFSEAAEYYEELVDIGHLGVDYGGFTWSAIQTLEKYGAMLEQSDVTTTTSWKNPPPNAWLDSLKITSKQAQSIIFNLSREAEFHAMVQDALANKHPILAGIDCYDGIYFPGANGVIPMPKGNPIGGHEIVLIDFDTTMTDPVNPGVVGYYKFRNTWSKAWGANGDGWLPMAYLAGNLSQAVVVAGVATLPKPAPKPVVTKTYDVVASGFTTAQEAHAAAREISTQYNVKVVVR